jgi:hypothetical protein
MQVHWRDVGGSTSECLLGALYVGCIMRIVPEKWREWAMNTEPLPSNAPEHMRIARENRLEHYAKYETTPWRAWIMRDGDGEPYGYFATEELAKQKLAEAVRDAVTALPATQP